MGLAGTSQLVSRLLFLSTQRCQNANATTWLRSAVGTDYTSDVYSPQFYVLHVELKRMQLRLGEQFWLFVLQVIVHWSLTLICNRLPSFASLLSSHKKFHSPISANCEPVDLKQKSAIREIQQTS